jgi:hypothetical protein
VIVTRCRVCWTSFTLTMQQVTYKGETDHLQDLCREMNANANRYLRLDDSVEDLGQRYVAVEEIPLEASCWQYTLAPSNDSGLE